jgi:hypothetical protein
MFQRHRRIASLGALAGALLLPSACSIEGEEAAEGNGVIIDRTTQGILAADVDSADGTYTGVTCTNRSGAWSVDLGGGGLLNAPLSVVLNDTTCRFSMTALHTTGGTLTLTPAIPIIATYAGSASSVGSPIQFYANAKIDDLNFDNDFVITLPYSDNSNLASDDRIASYSVVTSSATGSSVAAPEYTIEASGLVILTDVNDVVVSATGSATLTDVGVDGQTYVIVEASGLTTFAAIDAAYLGGGTPISLTLSIAAANFNLTAPAEDLTTDQFRTVIIANTVNGVRAYQAFEITFQDPP